MPLPSDIPVVEATKRRQFVAEESSLKDGEARMPAAANYAARNLVLSLDPRDLDDARRYRPEASAEEAPVFALRQLRSRRRLTLMLDFYRANHCRPARLHLLGGAAITLGRFAGYSRGFDELGDAFMPVNQAGEPRTAEWALYTEACRSKRPLESREELWLAAHMRDVESIREAGLDKQFYAEAAAHLEDPVWGLLKRHMEVTVGVRLMDHAALAGVVAYETAFAESLSLTVKRLFTAGWSLLGCYAWETMRALLIPRREPRRNLVSYRVAAFELIRYSITSWSASRVFRRGVRARERGSHANEDGWPLLEQVLGERISEIHPMISRFYTNPSRFKVKASLELHTLPAKLWSWLAVLIIGQGLYESDQREIEARFRIFRRADGSMHFIRELYCGDALRVFDSDFVVRDVNGRATLFEVFVDTKVDVEMDVEPTAEGGLLIQSRSICLRGVRLPFIGLRVEFHSRVVKNSRGLDVLELDGHLLMQPRTRLGRFLSYGLLRRPEQLGCIHYVAEPV